MNNIYLFYYYIVSVMTEYNKLSPLTKFSISGFLFKNCDETTEINNFKNFILEELYHKFNTKPETYLTKEAEQVNEQLIKIINEMTNNYENINHLKSIPSMEDYTNYTIKRLNLGISNIIKKVQIVSTINNFNNVYEITNNNVNEQYCNTFNKKIEEYKYETRIEGNVFVAKINTKLFNNQYVYISLTKLLSNYNYLGFVIFPFEKTKREQILHLYLFFKNKTTNEIITISNNGVLICNNELYEEYTLSYVLLNDLMYFNNNIRELNIYEYDNYIYFSQYTKYELKQINGLEEFVEKSKQMEIYKTLEKRLIPIISISSSQYSFIRKRLNERKNKPNVHDEEVMKRQYIKHSKEYLDDMYNNLYSEFDNLISYKSGSNYIIYLNKDYEQQLPILISLDKQLRILDESFKNIKTVDDYEKSSRKQLQELDELTIEKQLRTFRTALINLLEEPEKHDDLNMVKILKKNKDIIEQKYNITSDDPDKPYFFSNRDLIVSDEQLKEPITIDKQLKELIKNDEQLKKEYRNIDINKLIYLPEIKKLRKDNTELNDELLLKILSKRQLLLGKREVIDKSFVESTINKCLYIIDSFFASTSFPEDFDMDKFPQKLRWSPELNKTYVSVLGKRDLIFPVKVYYSNYSKFYYYINKNTAKFIGVIQFKLEKQKDLTFFLFIMNENKDGKEIQKLKIYDFRANEFILNQGLNTFNRWNFIEINVLYYYFKEILKKPLYFYKIKNESDQYLLSMYDLNTIKKKYNDLVLDVKELNNLEEVIWKQGDSLSHEFIPKLQTAGYIETEQLDSILNSFQLHELKVGNEPFTEQIIYDYTKFKDSFDILYNLPYKYKSLLNHYDILSKPIHETESIYSNFYVRLKKKFMYDHLVLPFFMTFIIFDMSKYKKILAVSKNYRIIEPIFYYLKHPKVTHIYYEPVVFYSNLYNVEENIKKIKKVFSFNDIHIGQIKKLDGKYDLLFLDIMHTSKIDGSTFENYYNQLHEHENKNLLLLNIINLLLKHIEKNGRLVLFIKSMISKDTLLLIQNTSRCFKKTYILDTFVFTGIFNNFVLLVFDRFTECKKPIDFLTDKFVKYIRKYYDKKLKRYETLIEQYKYIKNNETTSNFIDKLMDINQLYSYELARLLKFDVYDIRGDVNVSLLSALQKMFLTDRGQYITIQKHEQTLDFKINEGFYNLPNEILFQMKSACLSTDQIDFRDKDKYDKVKKFVRFYENTLNKELIKYNISIDRFRPVSRAWIKFYEILYTTRIYDYITENIKAFHICEAPGTFIVATNYYLQKWNPKVKYIWEASTLAPTTKIKDYIGDTYGLLRKHKDKWTYGADGTGDITKEVNIKYYHNICKDKDWIIGDCGLPYSTDSTPGILLFYSQMLFILYNLRDSGNCIFKQFFNLLDNKLLDDMFYLLYLSFQKVEIYKPTQNEFSPEFYVICKNYKKIITEKDFEILFSFLKNKDVNLKSFIPTYDKDFTIQFSGMLEKIINGLNQTIDRQLFYTDFWNMITEVDKSEIKKYINLKNKDWINYYLLRK